MHRMDSCTPAGKSKKYSDPSEVPHAVYVAERKASVEKDIEQFFQDNSPFYHYVEKLAKPLKDTHKVLRIAWSPETGGFPLRRERSYTSGINEATHMRLGPEDPDEVQRHFAHFLQRSLVSDFSIFMDAPPEMLQEEEVP